MLGVGGTSRDESSYESVAILLPASRGTTGNIGPELAMNAFLPQSEVLKRQPYKIEFIGQEKRRRDLSDEDSFRGNFHGSFNDPDSFHVS